jgi:FixJ family two-component response regulator
MRAGAAGFLTKPVRSETLLSSIRAAIEQCRGERDGETTRDEAN